MWTYNNTDELFHHGIKGQRWGFRRYQNKDGSLTPAGKRRADKLQAQYAKLTGKKITKNNVEVKVVNDKPKTVKEMTDAELAAKTNRMNLEMNYNAALSKYNPRQVSKGKKFIKYVGDNVVVPAVTDVGRQLFKTYLTKTINEQLDLSDEYKLHTNNKKKN